VQAFLEVAIVALAAGRATTPKPNISTSNSSRRKSIRTWRMEGMLAKKICGKCPQQCCTPFGEST